MVSIRSFIEQQLLDPLKRYPTIIQRTILELIIDKLETLYQYTVAFPEIVSPNSTRLDILRAITDQFLFTIRTEADLQEQINILDNILYVYSKRGSLDTIENMWKYYGGDLPKDVKVVIPSYDLFRYSVSKLSGTHVFQDNTTNRPGVYEVTLVNSNYPIPELKEFMLKELVAAGNRIYFSNALHMEVLDGDNSAYKYEVLESDLHDYQMLVLQEHRKGLTLSGSTALNHKLDPFHDNSMWSGALRLFVDVGLLIDLDPVSIKDYLVRKATLLYLPPMEILKDNDSSCKYALLEKYIHYIQESTSCITDNITINLDLTLLRDPDLIQYTQSLYEDTIIFLAPAITEYLIDVMSSDTRYITSTMYCTPSDENFIVSRNSYNRDGELVEHSYPGYFIVGATLLGEEVI